MKFLLFSDLHCNIRAAQRLVEQSTQADILIGAGDFAIGRRRLNDTIDILQTINKPTVLVPGNSESFAELTAVCQHCPTAHVLHGTGVTLSGIPFWGIGGGIPVTPFGAWSYDFTEAEARLLLDDCPANGVLVSHSPPRGTADLSSSGRRLGSVAVQEAMLAKQPKLLVCGHIHHSAGQIVPVGETTVINAGPQGVLWEW